MANYILINIFYLPTYSNLYLYHRVRVSIIYYRDKLE